MTSKEDLAAAETAAKAAEGSGAGDGQTNEAEITKLTTELDASKLLVTERDTTIETQGKSIDELTTANTQFAKDVAGSTDMAKQLTDSQNALEESRKTSATLTEQLETANTTNSGLQSRMLTTRRDALVSKYGMDAEKVAALDDVGLSALESTLPGVQLATTNGNTNNQNSAVGLGLDAGGSGGKDIANMSELDRMSSVIETLKPKS